MRRTLRRIAGLAALGLLVAFASGPQPASAQTVDDTSLFSTAVPPNVLLTVDTSVSMLEIMYHPEFERSSPNACPIFGRQWPNWGGPTSGTGHLHDDHGDTLYYNCDPNTDHCRFEIDDNEGDFQTTEEVTCADGSTEHTGYYERTFCGRERKLYVDGHLRCTHDTTWYSEVYVEWLFGSDADPYFIGNEWNSSTDPQMIDANDNGENYITGETYPLYKRSRITAAKDIAKEVIYRTNTNCSQSGGFPCAAGTRDKVRFGLARFESGFAKNGGHVKSPIDDFSSNGSALWDDIEDLEADGSTPISETLFKTYTYFMDRGSSRPLGADGSTMFPAYQYDTTGGDPTSNPPPDPMVCPSSGAPCSCQKSFVILLTDGFPDGDEFDDCGSRCAGFDDFGANLCSQATSGNRLIGDYDGDGDPEFSVPGDSCPWLNDIAKFMAENDYRPDESVFPGEQTIDVYTVGMGTSGDTNTLLKSTAQQGQGEFFTGLESGNLTDSLLTAIGSIIEKSQAFTAATVPATRTAAGGRIYTSRFVPSSSSGFWEGHLESWEITGSGEILDANGDCALDDPNAPAQCFSGPFVGTAVPFWDAGEELKESNNPSARHLSVSRLDGSGDPEKVSFDAATLDENDLDVSGADISRYNFGGNPDPSNAGELADMLVQNVRGCSLGTGVGGVDCVERDWLLGDIFHSNPLVIPGPADYVSEPSFQQFASDYRKRDRVIAAGANDGFLHIFHAGDWDDTANPERHGNGTGEEIAAFMPYPAREKVQELPVDTGSRDTYFVDGSPAAADVWFYDSPTSNAKASDGSEWRTVLMGGLRQGGESYYALDVTDSGDSSADGGERPSCRSLPGTSSPASSEAYPCYLWEFPREDAPASIEQWMGESWSEPVMTRVRVSVNGDDCGGEGCERWVAVFGAGYSPKSDPNDHSSYELEAEAGRALIMLDLKTGEVLGMKKFNDGLASTVDGILDIVPDHAAPEHRMLYGIAARPGVFDLDFDGFADVIYVGDLGGNLWKWVVDDVGVDPVNGAGSEDQPNWEFQKVFHAPIYCHSASGDDDECEDGDDEGQEYFKSFYNSPSAVLRNGEVWIAQGSGERADMEFEGFSGTSEENNRFYVIRDQQPLQMTQDTSELPDEEDSYLITEDELADRTGSGGCSQVTGKGFYFRARDGEKFVTETDILSYKTFVGTFTPEVATSPCEAGGRSRLYGFDVRCGEGAFSDPDTGDPVIEVDLGKGVPTDPKITISTQGSGEANRVIMNKQSATGSGGELDNRQCQGCSQGAGIGQFYWRELQE